MKTTSAEVAQSAVAQATAQVAQRAVVQARPIGAPTRLSNRDALAIALFALRGNWLRSVLTALGVIIGIAAVIVMVAIGNGTRADLDRMIESLGANRIDIAPSLGRVGGAISNLSSLFTLTQNDIAALRERVPEIEAISGVLNGRTTAVNAERNWTTQWQGVDPEFFSVGNWQLASGEWIASDAYQNASPQLLLGETVRQKLFGDEDPSGRLLRVGSVEFLIVGVLQKKGLGAGGNDQDDALFVPIETARRRLLGRIGIPPQTVMSVTLSVARPQDLAYVEREVGAVLRELHRIAPGAADDFTVRNLTQLVSARSQTTQLMSILLAVVAGISLLVGGIGIMNIMLVSVTERTREIGLRLSIGASPYSIRQQFLAEATMLSLGGGLFGILLGVVIAELLARWSSLSVLLNAQVIVIAAVFSIATGLFFGYYPASRAAKLDPIEALRQG